MGDCFCIIRNDKNLFNNFLNNSTLLDTATFSENPGLKPYSGFISHSETFYLRLNLIKFRIFDFWSNKNSIFGQTKFDFWSNKIRCLVKILEGFKLQKSASIRVFLMMFPKRKFFRTGGFLKFTIQYCFSQGRFFLNGSFFAETVTP